MIPEALRSVRTRSEEDFQARVFKGGVQVTNDGETLKNSHRLELQYTPNAGSVEGANTVLLHVAFVICVVVIHNREQMRLDSVLFA
jgi:hypothetical protein